VDREARKPRNSSAGGTGTASSTARLASPRLASAAFALSAHDSGQLPPPGPPEIAFAGRSNAGKSSAVNALTGRRRLAFASKTPGRTQLINFFSLDGRAFLVDLPGYGFAGVPEPVRQHWQRLVGDYVRDRPSIAGLVVVMDARHPLTPLDRQLLDWLAPAGRRIHVLLTKSDKLSAQAGQAVLARTRAELSSLYPGATAQLFSSLKRTGVGEAAAVVEAWATRKNKAPAKGE
jgi:GTP-binding protein